MTKPPFLQAFVHWYKKSYTNKEEYCDPYSTTSIAFDNQTM